MRKIIILLLCLAIILLTACTQNQRKLNDRIINEPIEYDPVAHEHIVAANEQFALQLYETLVRQSAEQPVFISPLSISLALAMAYNGADGETKQQLADALQLSGMTMEQVNSSLGALQQQIVSADPDVALAIANSIWTRKGISFHKHFLGTNQHYYGAEMRQLDFNRHDAADTINDWVARHTEQKINEIIQGPIANEAVMFLINAIYFKGDWTKPFQENRTREAPFYLSNGETITHPLMSQTGPFDYMENDHFQAIRLPYGKEEKISMLVFLPRESSDLNAFHSMLTTDNWSKWRDEFVNVEGSIQLPRFTMQYEETLNDVLKSLGMIDAFSPQSANFSNMLQTSANANTYVNTVKHKSMIEVNEVGTEAAAVTALDAAGSSMPINTFNMSVNRPFFFTILEEANGTILFMGAVEHPVDIN